jgi:hypothetical protein
MHSLAAPLVARGCGLAEPVQVGGARDRVNSSSRFPAFNARARCSSVT